jgi:hypothetical protein
MNRQFLPLVLSALLSAWLVAPRTVVSQEPATPPPSKPATDAPPPNETAKDTPAPAEDAATVPAPEEPTADPNQSPDEAQAAKDKLSPDIPGLTRLDKNGDLWIDPKRKIVVVDGRIALREGPIEMFACPKRTKEHESIVSVNTKASFVHAALLAVGAKSGTPVQWDPKYAPPTGGKVEVLVLWKDKEGKNHKARAQDWIINTQTKKPMKFDWVFAGSGFWVDEDTGMKYYHGDAGDLICVSNFATATLDIPVESSQENSNLLFEAATDKIPEKGTKVRLVLIPQQEKEKPQQEKVEPKQEQEEPKKDADPKLPQITEPQP